MTSKELSKYIGKYVSFDVDDLAYLPLPKIPEGKDMRNNNYHFKGILHTNTGTRSHFSLDTEVGGVAILDKDIPFIKNFKVKETKMNKERIKDMLIYLDLSLNETRGLINTEGIAALFQLQEKYKGISDSQIRHDMICEIMKELDENE